MNKVGIYLRVSTEEQSRIQDGSLVSQRRRLEEYVESQIKREQGWGLIIDVYCDEARSGKDMNRPEFQRMLDDVRSGRINLVLATELSRLSRSIKDFCGLWDLFKDHGTKFVTLRENFDTTTASGEMMVFQLIGFAQFERKQTAERISANWKSRASRGLWNGGSIPLGFDRNPNNKGILIPNPEEVETVKKIFQIFIETGSLRQACLKLSQLGFRSKSYVNKHGLAKGGDHFTLSALYNLLTNQALIGMREVGTKAERNAQNIELIPAAWPAIIERETFEAVQAMLEKNKRRYKPIEKKNYPYPLTDKLICGECGKHLGGQSAHGKIRTHFYYGHSRKLGDKGKEHLIRCRLERIRAPRMDEMATTFVQDLLKNSTLLNHAIESYQKKTVADMPGVAGRLKTVESEIRLYEKRSQNLMARLADLPPDIPAESIYEQLREINSKIAESKTAKARLNDEKHKFEAKELDTDALKTRLARAVEILSQTPIEKQKAIFENLFQFIELHPTKMRLGLYAPIKTKTPEDERDARPPGPFFVSNSDNVLDFPKRFQAERVRSIAVCNGAPGGT